MKFSQQKIVWTSDVLFPTNTSVFFCYCNSGCIPWGCLLPAKGLKNWKNVAREWQMEFNSGKYNVMYFGMFKQVRTFAMIRRTLGNDIGLLCAISVWCIISTLLYLCLCTLRFLLNCVQKMNFTLPAHMWQWSSIDWIIKQWDLGVPHSYLKWWR